MHSGRFWYVLSEPAKVYREEEEWRKYQVVCFWRDYDNDDTLCATGKNGISHGRNGVEELTVRNVSRLFMELCVLFRRLHCCHFCWEMWRNTEVRERRWQEES